MSGLVGDGGVKGGGATDRPVLLIFPPPGDWRRYGYDERSEGETLLSHSN